MSLYKPDIGMASDDKVPEVAAEARTLRARGGNAKDPDPSKRPTDPKELSKSVLKSVGLHGYAEVESIGAVALSRVLDAYRLADVEHIRASSVKSRLAVVQSEFTRELGGEVAKGVCTRIFPIQIDLAR